MKKNTKEVSALRYFSQNNSCPRNLCRRVWHYFLSLLMWSGELRHVKGVACKHHKDTEECSNSWMLMLMDSKRIRKKMGTSDNCHFKSNYGRFPTKTKKKQSQLRKKSGRNKRVFHFIPCLSHFSAKLFLLVFLCSFLYFFSGKFLTFPAIIS